MHYAVTQNCLGSHFMSVHRETHSFFLTLMQYHSLFLHCPTVGHSHFPSYFCFYKKCCKKKNLLYTLYIYTLPWDYVASGSLR